MEEALQEVNMVVEGVTTCKAAYELARSLKVEMPITVQLHQVLFEGKDPSLTVRELMLRDKTQESEFLADDLHNQWL